MASFAVLFGIIEKAKNVKSFDLANLAFATLLDEALNHPKELKFLWESDSCGDWRAYSPSLNYYDLAVISDGIRSACIPAPLLRDKYAKAFMSMSEIIDRKEHNRLLGWDAFDKLPYLEAYLQSLLDELLADFPNAIALGEKYLTQQSPCEKCPYYFGRNEINCAPHPSGLPESGCVEIIKKEFSIDVDKARDLLEYELEYKKDAEFDRLMWQVKHKQTATQSDRLPSLVLQSDSQYKQKLEQFAQRFGSKI
jgi:hypothetical protein